MCFCAEEKAKEEKPVVMIPCPACKEEVKMHTCDEAMLEIAKNIKELRETKEEKPYCSVCKKPLDTELERSAMFHRSCWHDMRNENSRITKGICNDYKILGYISLGHNGRVSDLSMNEEQDIHLSDALSRLSKVMTDILPTWQIIGIEIKEAEHETCLCDDVQTCYNCTIKGGEQQ
jgi:hypothetical protein